MKQINLDEACKKELIEKFTEYVNKTRLTNDQINFTANLSPCAEPADAQKPTVFISTTAYLKMMLYVRDTDVEIAWHGTVERNQEQNWYLIKDVFLYPQVISAVTVNTDQEEYQNWLQNIEDDNVFNSIRFQGHSHVNMSTRPSGTDISMYNDFLQVLPKNDFYIFMILNKRGEFTLMIYDLAKNLIYEDNDINVKIFSADSQDILTAIQNEKDKYCTRHTPPASTTFKPIANSYHTPFGQPIRHNTSYYDLDNYVDEIFEDMDNKYNKHSKHSYTKKRAKFK